MRQMFVAILCLVNVNREINLGHISRHAHATPAEPSQEGLWLRYIAIVVSQSLSLIFPKTHKKVDHQNSIKINNSI